MKMFLSMAMLVACIAFVGCGGVAEQPAADGISQEQMEEVKNEQAAAMGADYMEKMKQSSGASGGKAPTYEK